MNPWKPFMTGRPEVLAVDAALKRQYHFQGAILPFAPLTLQRTPLEWFNVTDYITEAAAFMELTNIKYPNPRSPAFTDMFTWLTGAAFDGNVTQPDGTLLLRWVRDSDEPGKAYSLLLLATTDGVPVFLDQNVTLPAYPVSANSSYPAAMRLQYTFHSFSPGGEPDGCTWACFNETLFTQPARCSDALFSKRSKTSAHMSTFVFHPRWNFEIANQDHGDLQGDVTFVCEDLINGGYTNSSLNDTYQWISQWAVEYEPRFGQYQNCNGYAPENFCYGAETFYVGHEAALGMGPSAELNLTGGQCTSNPDVGEWFSLPAAGRCAEGAVPGDGTCTWAARRQKTIDCGCLFGHGYLAACQAGGGRAPFSRAVRLFHAAFASADEGRGGCPEIYEARAADVREESEPERGARERRDANTVNSVVGS